MKTKLHWILTAGLLVGGNVGFCAQPGEVDWDFDSPDIQGRYYRLADYFTDFGPVGAIALQPNGKIVIAGGFHSVNGVTRTNIARLNANGSLDLSFDAGDGIQGSSAAVNAIALQSNGKIVVGGRFEAVNGVGRNGIARLNADGSLDTTFDPGAGVERVVSQTGEVTSLLVQPDGKIVIGGLFLSVDGVARTNIARLNSDGTLDTGFSAGIDGASQFFTYGYINALTRQSDAKIILGGWFHSVNGVLRTNLARLNSDGSLDLTYDPGLGMRGYPSATDSPRVESLLVQPDGKLVVGGDFWSIAGANRTNIARLNGDGSIDTTFASIAEYGWPQAQAISMQTDGKLFVGFGTTLYRVYSDGSLDPSFQPHSTNGVVLFPLIIGNPQFRAIVVEPDGKVLVGGATLWDNGDGTGNFPHGVTRFLATGVIPLTVTVNDTNRLYGQTNPPLTGTITGLLTNDNITATFVSTATVGSPPGDYLITVQWNDPLERLSNYSIVTNLGTLTVECLTNLATVTSLADSGPGSLRDAVVGLCDDGIIQFTVTGNIVLTSGQIVLDKNLSLIGPGATNLTIIAPAEDRVFEIAPGATVAISGLTLDGNSQVVFAYAQGTIVGWEDVDVVVDYGGGIFNQGDLTLTECVIRNGAANNGGGVANAGIMVADRCLFEANISGTDGGGILSSGTLNLTNCTVSANYAFEFGGGGISGGDMNLVNCTIAFNILPPYAEFHGPGGLISFGGNRFIWNTIIAGNIGLHTTLHGPPAQTIYDFVAVGSVSGDYNLIQHSHSDVPGIHSISNTPAFLLPLAYNGGQTRTHALSVGSPALNSGTSDGAPLVDQRGSLRPGGAGYDMGAFEAGLNLPPLVANPIPDQTNTYGSASDFTFVTNVFSDPDPGQTLSYTASNMPPGIEFNGPTRTFSGTNTTVGNWLVTVTATDDGSPVLSTNATFAFGVGKAQLQASVIAKTNTYGEFIFVSAFSDVAYTGFLFFDSLFDLDTFPDISTTATNGSPVGVYPIALSGGLDDNYEFIFQDGTLTLEKTDLTVVVDSYCRPLGETNPPLTATLLGIQFGDNLTAQLTTTAATNSPLGNYPISVTLNDPDGKLPNYNLTTITGTLSVVDFTLEYEIVRSFGFTNLMGHLPHTRAIEGSDGMLYGATDSGIYRIHKNGSGYTLLSTNGSRAPLLEGSDGILYGTADANVGAGTGTVFKLNRDGSGYSILYNFTGGAADGDSPSSALIEGTNGVLYGNTQFGGVNDRGTLFKMNKDGTGYAVFHHFSTFGRYPTTPLIQATDGQLYGATRIGGPSFGGTVFTINEDGTGFTVLRAFGLVGGFTPMSPQDVMEGSDGALYATTQQDGAAGFGTIFKMNKDGSGYTVLHEFAATLDGKLPRGGLIEASDGKIYGATQWGDSTASGSLFSGFGAVFKVNKDGTGYGLVLDVGPEANGPLGVIEGTDTKLYGVCAGGGAAQGGTIFTVNRDGTSGMVLWNFNLTGGDGRLPSAALIEGSDGKLYGVTEWGGSGGSPNFGPVGTVFSVNKNGSNPTVLHSFTNGPADAMNPRVPVLEGNDGILYGLADNKLYRLNRDGTGYTNLHTFIFGEGQSLASLTEGTDGVLYGTASLGGSSFNGTLFKVNKDGSGLTVLRSFGSVGFDGSGPNSLIQGNDGLLYGTTASGGSNNAGIVFQINTNGGSYAVLYALGNNDGAYYPSGGLHMDTNGVLFGTTTSGGSIGYGTVFRLNSDGTGFQILHGFLGTQTDGAYPTGTLTESTDGTLYGTTSGDSFANLSSTVFHLNKDGSDYCVLHVFGTGDADGRSVIGGVIAASDGAFYGVTSAGGSSGFGTIFKLQLSELLLNASPFVANPISNQTNTYGASFNYAFPTNTFGDPDAGQTLSYAASGMPPGISFSPATRTFSGTLVNVGTFSVVVTATDDGSPAMSTNDVFDLAVEKAPLLAIADDKARSYGAANPPLTISYSGFVLGETAVSLGSPPVAGTSAAPTNSVGTYPITLTGGTDAHYSLTLSNGTLTITNATLIVTANNTNRPYGQANPVFTGSITGIQNSDNITATFVSAALPSSLPGSYPITPVLSDPDSRLINYLTTTNNGALNVECLTSMTVTSLDDSGAGSLRDALAAVCNDGMIDFAVTGTIALNNRLDVNRSVNITGPGATNLTISGSNSNRVFHISAGTNHISGVTISHGRSVSDPFPSNRSGGILNEARLTLDSCILASNVAGLYAGGLGNMASATLILRNTLFVGNQAGNDGGALVNNGVAYLTNCTFSSNTSLYDAGGIYNSGDMVIESCTVTANRADGIAGGFNNDGGTVLLHNTIIAANSNSAPNTHDIAGAITAGDYNLVGYTNGLTLPGSNNVLGVPPLLGPLSNNGGLTLSHLPLPGSPAIDAGDPASLLNVDQRGFARPQGIRVDIGSVEVTETITPPLLSIEQTAPGLVTLSWSPPTTGFVLQTNLTFNPFTWGNAPSGSTNPVTVPVILDGQFFRLHKP